MTKLDGLNIKPVLKKNVWTKKKKVKSTTRTDTPLVQECPSRNNIKLSEFDWGGTNLYVCCHEKQEED